MLVDDGRHVEKAACAAVEEEHLTVVGQAPDAAAGFRRRNLQQPVGGQRALMPRVVVESGECVTVIAVQPVP